MGKSRAFAAAGTKVYLGAGDDWATETSGTWTEMGDVINIDGPGFGRNTIDCTHMTSPNNEEEFLSGRKVRSEIQLAMSFAPDDPTQNPDTGLKAIRDDGGERAFAFVYSNDDESCYLFNAIVSDFKITAQQAGKVDATCTLKLTGADDWVDGGLPA